MSEQILQQEDTVSADRKQRIIFDPEAWKKSDKSGRTITSVTSRQNFNNSKYGNRKNKDDDEDDIKEEKSQIKFVTGNDAIATQVGQEKMKKDKIKKIAEAVVKKALHQISIDKNAGIKEIPTNESTNENAVDMVNESSFNSSAYSHIRSLARKAMNEGWEPEPEVKKPHTPDDAKLKSDAKKNKEALDKISAAFAKKKVDEEVEQLDELEQSTLQSYVSKAGADMKKKSIERSKLSQQRHSKEIAAGTRKPGELSDSETNKPSDKENEISSKNTKRYLNVQKAEKKIWKKNNTPEKVAARVAATKEKHKRISDGIKSVDKLAAELHRKKMQEEVEHIDELKKSTLGSYIQKASADASYHANAAGFKAGVKQPKYNTSDDTPTEKKRAKGIATAVKKLTKEELEQIDELSKTTLGDYIKGASKDASSKILTGVTKGNNKDLVGANKDLRVAAKRNSGIKKAVDKLTKEGTEMSKLTFKQFVEQLDEMVEFVVTNEEVEQILEYTPGAGGVTRVTGKSYGANYHDPEGDDDADDKPAAKPAEAPAKRGRGRPAGSYGSYKARSAETRAAAAAKSAASKAANKAAKND